MGWNSWDSYGLTITEAELRANAAALHDQLAPAGWRYVVLDEGWYFPNPSERPHPEQLRYALDESGRFLPAPLRFPSAAGQLVHTDGSSDIYSNSPGLRSVADWLHSQHLLFGIHIIRGIPRESVRLNLPIAGSSYHAKDAADITDACPWDPTSWGIRDNAAGQAWYDSLLRQYANWGVDFLKVDCIADHPYRPTEIQQIHNAIEKTGRTIVLSLSPGPTAIDHAKEVQLLAQMWRISNDVWDVWNSQRSFPVSVRSQFARLAEWESYAKPGDWPDADMLPFGELRPKPDVGPGPRTSRLTPEEQRTQFTLWAFARSPLILGANLTMLTPELTHMLTNAAILRVNQTATNSRQIVADGDFFIWRADTPTGPAFAFFNTGDKPVGLTDEHDRFREVGCRKLQDVWTGRIDKGGMMAPLELAPHSSLAYTANPAWCTAVQ